LTNVTREHFIEAISRESKESLSGNRIGKEPMNTTKMSGGIEYARRHFLSVAAMGLAAEKTKKQNKQTNGDMK